MNKEILRDIGLTDYEAEIYLVLLSSGQVSAYELAEKAGLYRQVVYDSLKRLLEKGYVNCVVEGKTKLFRAIDPQLILAYLDEKRNRFTEILPELVQLNEESKQPIMVETYKGKNITRIGFKDIINHLKKTGGENLCTAVDEHFAYVKYKTEVDQYERDLLKYGFKERVIITKGTKGLLQKGTSKYRKIPTKFFNQNPTQIYGDNVNIMIWGNPDYLIIIRSKEVAEAYRKQFELLWKVAEK